PPRAGGRPGDRPSRRSGTPRGPSRRSGGAGPAGPPGSPRGAQHPPRATRRNPARTKWPSGAVYRPVDRSPRRPYDSRMVRYRPLRLLWALALVVILWAATGLAIDAARSSPSPNPTGIALDAPAEPSQPARGGATSAALSSATPTTPDAEGAPAGVPAATTGAIRPGSVNAT